MARKRKVNRDDLASFRDEVLGSLPGIARGVLAFEADPNQVDELFESYRLTHTIKGAASMLGLSALSHIAYCQEDVLEKLASGDLEMSHEAASALERLSDLIRTYVDDLNDGSADGEGLLAEATRIQRRLLGLPATDDEAAIDQALSAAASQAESLSIDGPDAPPPGPPVEVGPDHHETFRAEADDHLRAIVACLSDYRHDPADVARLGEVRARVHSLKGAAGTLGFGDMAKVAHRVEDSLEHLIEGRLKPSERTTSLLFSAMDLIEDLIHGQGGDLGGVLARFDGLIGPADDVPPPQATTTEPPIELDDIESISPDLIEVFSQEADDHLRNIYSALGELDKKPGDRAALQAVRRGAHTLKGAAGAVKLRTLTKLAHRMEDLLDELYEAEATVSPEVMKLLLATTDVLDDLSHGKYERETMTASVRRLYAQFQAHLAPPEAAPVPAAPAARPAPAVIDIGGAAPVVAPPRVVPRKAKPDSPGRGPRKAGDVLRVPIERVDELVRLVSELVINRTGFEQRLVEFNRTIEEHRRSLARIRKISAELETDYEVSELGGGRRLSGGPGGPGRNRIRFLGEPARDDEFDELEFDRYTRFHLLSRTLAESTSDINTLGNELHNLAGDFETLLTRQGRLSREIQDKLMRIRMVPLDSLATGMHRAVRVVAQSQGKDVELVFEGESIELDKSVLEEMSDAFLHLLRNAVDHGVEPPSVRIVRGKPERAVIHVRAYYQGTQVVIQIADDGAGLDPANIRAAAVRGGHATAAEVEAMSDEEALQLIFLPGFSTALEVSEVSGRGVGMEIVKLKVHKLKGTLSIESSPGQGTTFTIRLPMTLAITRALMVRAHGESFAIPVQSVTQILRVERQKVEKVGQDSVIRAGGKVFPLMRLGEALRLKQPPDESRTTLPVLIVNVGSRQVALVVDQLVVNREIVVKTLGAHLRRVHGLIGATLLGDGTVVPILNPMELVQETVRFESKPSTTAPRVAAAREEDWSILVVDDSVSVRRVVTNLIKAQGWEPIAARDGLDALEILHNAKRPPDLILLDIEMPRMDGYELLGALRSQAAYAHLPIVMVTSRAGEKHRRKALQLGATDYVVKPYEDDALVALVKRLVRAAREEVVVA